MTTEIDTKLESTISEENKRIIEELRSEYKWEYKYWGNGDPVPSSIWFTDYKRGLSYYLDAHKWSCPDLLKQYWDQIHNCIQPETTEYN